MNRKTLFCTLGLMSCLLIQAGCDEKGGVASPNETPTETPNENTLVDPAPELMPENVAADQNVTTQPTTDSFIKTEIIQTPGFSTPDDRQIKMLKACKSGDLQQIRSLVEQGASVNISDNKFNNSPIMHATISNCIPCMEFLIEYGADIHHRNSASADALIWASMQCTAETVQFLLNHGADPNVATPSGKNALSMANARPDDSHKAMIIVLLEQALSLD